MSRFFATLALVVLACQSPARAPTAEPIPMPSAPSSSAPAPVAIPVAPPSDPPPPPAPPAGPGSLSITVDFPRVAVKPPVLTLAIYNRTREPFPYQEHQSAPCQIALLRRSASASLLAFTMKNAAGKALPMAKCTPSPSVDRTVAAGAKVELALPLAELYPGLGNGSYDIDVSWLPEKPGAAASPQRQLSQPGRPLTIRPVVRSIVVKRGETVQLAGATLTFSGHSHKDVDERSAPSPLIIEGTLTPVGGKADTFYVHVQPDARRPDSRIFAVADHYFELGEYEYGASMHLAYFGQLR